MCCGAKIWMYTCGGIFTPLGIILIIFWPGWAVDIMYSVMPLAPNSFLYNHWVETPVPLYMTFYLYNWTNSDQVGNPNVKPNFIEHGPYVFRDMKEKKILNWDDESSTVTYVDHRVWLFQPDLSGGSPDDLIIAPHFPSVSVSKLTRDLPKTIRKIANFTLANEGGALTMQATAMEWLFDGFYDDLFDFAEKLHSPLVPIYSNNFAWFYRRNGSTGAEGNFTIHTGKKDIYQLADIKLWNGTSHTGYWEGDCGKVNGSSGELYSPGKPWSAVVSILIPEVARFINLFPKEEVEYDDIKAWRYESTDQTFDSGYIAPDTKCFCAKNKPCPAPGAIDFSPVAFGAPVYVSHPHFYLADPSYLENTTGFAPNPEKDISYLIIEPTLAAPLKAAGQALISILVEQDDAIDIFKDVSYNFYAPLLAVAITAEITSDLIGFVRFATYTPTIGLIIGIIFAVGGGVVLIVAIVFSLTNRWDKGKQNSENNELGNNPPATTDTSRQGSVSEINEVSQKATTELLNDDAKPISSGNARKISEILEQDETDENLTEDSNVKKLEAGNIEKSENNASTIETDNEVKANGASTEDKVGNLSEDKSAATDGTHVDNELVKQMLLQVPPVI